MLRKERKWNHVKCSVKIINGWKRMEEKNRNKWQEQQIETMIKMVVVNPSCEVAQSCPTLCDPMDCSPPAPPSMEFSRQEYWSGLPFPSPGDLPNPGIKPTSPASPALAGGFFTTTTTWEALPEGQSPLPVQSITRKT